MKKIIIFIFFTIISVVTFAQSVIVQNAENLFKAGRFNESLEILNEIISQSPHDMYALMDRSCVLEALNEYERALQDIEVVIKNEPFNLKAIHFRAGIYERLGKHEKAIQDETYVLDKIPSYASAHNVRGFAYGSLQQYEESLKDFTSAIVCGLNNNENVDSYYLNRGYTYYFLKKYDEALSDANEAIILNKKNIEPIILKSQIYRQKLEFEEAIKWITDAIKIKPDYYEIYYLRIVEYLELNQYENAEKDLAYIKNAMSGYSAYHALLALYYHKTGNDFRALKEIKLSQELKVTEKKQFSIKVLTDELGETLLKTMENLQLE